jgi:excisionase family DNA binding protein
VTRRTVEVDAAALRRLIAAATGTPDPTGIGHALADLLATGTRAGDWLTVDQAAHLLGVSARTVRRRCHDGTLPHRRLGRLLLVARAALAPPSGHEVTGRTQRTRR